MAGSQVEFRDIEFGKVGAEAERGSTPELLRDAFLDDEGFEHQLIAYPSNYVVIGPKGSGKSALTFRIEFSAAGLSTTGK